MDNDMQQDSSEQDQTEQGYRRQWDEEKNTEIADRDRQSRQDKDAGVQDGGQEQREKQKDKDSSKVSGSQILGKVKQFKTIILVIRVFATWGLDFLAWAQLFKHKPVLAVLLASAIILLIMAIGIFLVTVIIYGICKIIWFAKAVSWLASLINKQYAFCAYFD